MYVSGNEVDTVTVDERMRLSFYRELSVLDEEHEVFVVQHVETKALYLRKELTNYQLDIFERLKANPVPNMPRIIEAVEDGNKLIVIESYLTGETLHQRLEKEGVFLPQRVRSIGVQLCDILGRLHSLGIIHRDIKPENIIYEDPGVIKLLDLDAAKVYKAGESRDTLLIGTKEYAAPEQYGFGASSPATDIYAVGVLLNVLATGTFPRIKRAEDPGLAAIIQCCIKMDPHERYSSAYDLKGALLQEQSQPMNVSVPYGGAQQDPDTSLRQGLPVNQSPVSQQAITPTKSSYRLDSVMNAGTGWKRFLPPGFRSLNFAHIIIAAIYYISVASYIVKEAAEQEALRTYHSIVIFVAGPLVFCNYLGVLDLFRVTRIRRPIPRIIVAGCVFLFITVVLFGVGNLLFS